MCLNHVQQMFYILLRLLRRELQSFLSLWYNCVDCRLPMIVVEWMWCSLVIVHIALLHTNRESMRNQKRIFGIEIGNWNYQLAMLYNIHLLSVCNNRNNLLSFAYLTFFLQFEIVVGSCACACSCSSCSYHGRIYRHSVVFMSFSSYWTAIRLFGLSFVLRLHVYCVHYFL